MIKVNKIDVQTIEHFSNDGKSLGFLNEYESTDLRCQIAERNVSGYYLMFNGQKIEILPDGKVADWQPGMFDALEIFYARLFKAQRQ